MKTNNNIPAYRFQGYTDAWELRKLGEVLIKNSKRNKDLRIINVESVSNRLGFVKQTEQFEDYSVASSDLSNYYVISEKQFAYNPSRINVGSIAYKKLGEESSVVSPLYVSFSTSENVEDYYLWYWFKTELFHSQRIVFSEGGVRDTLSYNQLSEIILSLPPFPEQEAIGTFFSTLDRHITLHQRKLDTLKEQKKTYLKLLFPAKGQTKPALRFQGFEDDWEEVKLGEVVNIQKGTQRGKQEISEIQSEQFPYPVYNGGQNVSGYTDEYNRENMVIVSEGGASAGYVNYYSGKFWSGGHNFSIDNLDNNLLFIKSILEFNQQKLYELKVGSGLPNVQLGSINQFVLSLPSLPEQEAIGIFFQTLDQEMTQVEDKLASLKEMKKTLLRKLFVS